MTDDNIVWHNHQVSHDDRARQKGQKPALLWFTGLSGSGKSTIANAVEMRLFEMGCHSFLLDGDNVRHGLCKDLTFSDVDRVENVRRVGEVAKLMVDSGLFVLSAFISPFRAERALVGGLLDPGKFIEIYVDTPLAICEQRDPKKLYQKARQGLIANFTGIDSAYEAPLRPDVHLKTAEMSIEACVEAVLAHMKAQGLTNQ